ncbi:methyl-accepting chemotaxis protein [Rhodocyclus tenuis]|uniref:Aerotaxis receptor n=1 Tax=Rhodocyclus tenuis TaxID=1066 RepID=A0A840GA72_RHOTE|nr:PAS domain-containing methyl-accepting chemotaxis protein [Rhodocyclus tenuis]MBB4248746.1 aerotaxis receptor [Rhodocyclus tenuis]MBK1680918.1 chemotaxis protein [Rhodocyclus tenuis]
MRNNQPVTAVETLLPEGEFIYSRTDLKGMIVEANAAFAKVSAYTREEMIGQPHNLVRHPDMPVEAFADMWADLKAGRPWRGLVKNRRSDGGFYWVVANASPVRENGNVVGYQSVRSRPTRDEIAAAQDAYKRLKAGDKAIRVEHGRIVHSRTGLVSSLLEIYTQMGAIGLISILLGALLLLPESLDIPFLPWVKMGLGTFGIVSGLGFLLLFVPHLRRDLGAINDYLERVLTTGNLRQRLFLKRRDAIGGVASRVDCFVSSIQATVQGMDDSAIQVQRVSHEVEQGVDNVADSARVQSDATSAAAAGIEEITVSISEVTAHAAATRTAAQEASEASLRGAELSAKASTTILALAETVKESAAQVELLGEQSEEISRITGVIREIADQTNLLALNAAIEAARAGEQGRGFAVVADEVRKLAERTGKATQEISDMIGAIQSETQKAVDGMRSGATQVETGVLLVQDAQTALTEINSQMGVTVGMVNDISHSSSEQQEAMTLMAQSVERVATMTEQNVAVVAQTHGAVETLNGVVERMRKSVNQFSV